MDQFIRSTITSQSNLRSDDIRESTSYRTQQKLCFEHFLIIFRAAHDQHEPTCTRPHTTYQLDYSHETFTVYWYNTQEVTVEKVFRNMKN